MRRRLRLQRWLVLSALAVLVLGVPASASDRYDDVAPGSTHAEAIRELAEAGVTTGCTDAGFCPEVPVRRDQLASFIARSTPRATASSSTTTIGPGDDFRGVPVSVDVRATGSPGGTGVVTLQGSVTVLSDGAPTGCPCEVEAFVYRASDDEQGPSSWSQLSGQAASSGRASTALPVSWQTEIPSGSTESFRIAVFLNGVSGTGPGELEVEATLTATATALP